MPIMGKMAEIPEASSDLKLLLANNPPWRPQFFGSFPRSITDARTPLDFLLSVKDSANPPSASELQPYLDFLIQHGFYDLAYYTWLQFLPPERLAQAGHLYNGGFDATPSGTPFDWVLTKGTGVTAQVAAKGDKPGERALFLQFGPGRVDYREVTELIMLGPGNYQFHGKYKGDVVSERASRVARHLRRQRSEYHRSRPRRSRRHHHAVERPRILFRGARGKLPGAICEARL